MNEVIKRVDLKTDAHNVSVYCKLTEDGRFFVFTSEGSLYNNELGVELSICGDAVNCRCKKDLALVLNTRMVTDAQMREAEIAHNDILFRENEIKARVRAYADSGFSIACIAQAIERELAIALGLDEIRAVLSESLRQDRSD